MPITSIAQEHEFQTFGVNDGLPSYRISQILQDNEGRIISGTLDGLSIFNGYNFRNYTEFKGKPDDWIQNLAYSQDKGLWFITSNLSIFQLNNKQLKAHPANDSLTLKYLEYPSTHISFGFIENDTIVIGFENKPYRLKVAPNGTVVKETIAKPYRIYVNTKGSSIIYGYGKLPSFTTANELIWNGEKIKISNIAIEGKMRACIGNSGELLVTLSNSLFIVKETSEVKRVEIGRNAHSICVDKEGHIWLGFNNGAEHRNSSGETVMERLLPNEFCMSIIEDVEGNMWFGTSKGIFKIIGRDTRHYTHSNKGPLVQQFHPYLHSYKGSLWVVSSKGYFKLENDSILEQDVSIIRERVKPQPERLHLDTRLGVAQIQGDSLAFITPIGQFYRSAYFEQDGSYWSCRGFDLVHFDSDGNEIYDSRKAGFNPKKYDQDIVPFGRVHLKDPSGKLWVNLGTGLYTYFNDSITPFKKTHGEFELIRINFMLLIKGVLWASTLENGLWALHGDSIYHFGTENHLLSNKCRALVRESDSTLWLATANGLYRLDFSFDEGILNSSIKHFRQSDGLRSILIERAVYAENRLWVSSESVLSSINTKKLRKRKVPHPPIQLSRIRVNDKPAITDSLPLLRHDENNIGIDFIGITHLGTELPKYQFRMLGTDSIWRTTHDTSIQYSGLAPGSYQFQVRTISNAGLSSLIPATTSITILKPYWQRWWFIISIILGVQIITALIVLVITRLRRRALISEKNTLLAELKALRLQVNPHFMFNALNNIREMVNQGDHSEAPQQILRFSQLMRKILNASRKEQISLADEVDLIKSYLAFAQTRFHDKVKYRVQMSDEVKAMDEVVNIPPLITQPIVENALIHGASKALNEGLMEVNINKVENYIRCQIIDNGPGFKQKEKNPRSSHASIGMSLISDQIEKINASRKVQIRFSIFSGEKWNNGLGGTCVQLDVPIES